METLNVIATRKSTRAFNGKQIDEKALDTVLKAACNAPVARGIYEWLHFTVIQDTELLAEISALGGGTFGNPPKNPIKGVPTLIVVSTPNGKFHEWEIGNAGSVSTFMLYAATELGIDSIFLMSVVLALKKNEELLAKLQLPAGFEPINAVALGYSDEAPGNGYRTEHKITVNRV
jgi:nitroreductase